MRCINQRTFFKPPIQEKWKWPFPFGQEYILYNTLPHFKNELGICRIYSTWFLNLVYCCSYDVHQAMRELYLQCLSKESVADIKLKSMPLADLADLAEGSVAIDAEGLNTLNKLDITHEDTGDYFVSFTHLWENVSKKQNPLGLILCNPKISFPTQLNKLWNFLSESKVPILLSISVVMANGSDRHRIAIVKDIISRIYVFDPNSGLSQPIQSFSQFWNYLFGVTIMNSIGRNSKLYSCFLILNSHEDTAATSFSKLQNDASFCQLAMNIIGNKYNEYFLRDKNLTSKAHNGLKLPDISLAGPSQQKSLF